MSASGEIYFIGEKDLRTKEITSYYKVGLVRENVENADRSSTQRLLEHQMQIVDLNRNNQRVLIQLKMLDFRYICLDLPLNAFK